MRFRRDPSIAGALWTVWRRTAVVTTALGLVCMAIFVVAFGVLHPRLHRAIEASNPSRDLGAGLSVQETALRGLLVTGDGQFLDAYTGAVHQVQRARVPIESFDSPRTRQLLAATDAWQDQWAAVALLPRGGSPTPRSSARVTGSPATFATPTRPRARNWSGTCGSRKNPRTCCSASASVSRWRRS